MAFDREIGAEPFELDILGTRLLIRHDSSPEHMSEVAALLRHKVETVRKEIGAPDALRVIILTAFYLVNELMEERGERAMLPSISMVDGRKIEELFIDMRKALDSVLPEQKPNSEFENSVGVDEKSDFSSAL